MGLARSTGRVMPRKQIVHAMKSPSPQGNTLSALKMVSAGKINVTLLIIIIILFKLRKVLNWLATKWLNSQWLILCSCISIIKPPSLLTGCKDTNVLQIMTVAVVAAVRKDVCLTGGVNLEISFIRLCVLTPGTSANRKVMPQGTARGLLDGTVNVCRSRMMANSVCIDLSVTVSDKVHIRSHDSLDSCQFQINWWWLKMSWSTMTSPLDPGASEKMFENHHFYQAEHILQHIRLP